MGSLTKKTQCLLHLWSYNKLSFMGFRNSEFDTRAQKQSPHLLTHGPPRVLRVSRVSLSALAFTDTRPTPSAQGKLCVSKCNYKYTNEVCVFGDHLKKRLIAKVNNYKSTADVAVSAGTTASACSKRQRWLTQAAQWYTERLSVCDWKCGLRVLRSQ